MPTVFGRWQARFLLFYNLYEVPRQAGIPQILTKTHCSHQHSCTLLIPIPQLSSSESSWHFVLIKCIFCRAIVLHIVVSWFLLGGAHASLPAILDSSVFRLIIHLLVLYKYYLKTSLVFVSGRGDGGSYPKPQSPSRTASKNHSYAPSVIKRSSRYFF